MAELSNWIDLLDPGEAEIREHVPAGLSPDALAQLVAPARPSGGARPAIRSEGRYVLGVLLVAVAVPEEDRIFYQEVDFVVDRERIVTVRKTPDSEPPFDPSTVRAVCTARAGGELSVGMIAFHLVDDVAERYLALLEDVNGEIDELEEHVDDWASHRVRERLSSLRHDLLHVRRTLGPTRDAVRGIVDGRVDVRGRLPFAREVFPDEIERRFATSYDKLLRAGEMLELARDLLAAVRDYQQSRVAQDQNEVVKRLTAIASLLLFPTFWVGVYGQNFDHMPELRWRLGYLFSWAVIAAGTVLQLVYFRRKRWL